MPLTPPLTRCTPQVQGLQVGRLTDSGDGLGVGHQPPGIRGEEASAMEDARGEANVLLELLLDPSAPGALLKDHLLVDLILSKRVGGNQVGSGRERPGLSLPSHWLQFLLSALEALDTSQAPLPQGCARTPRAVPNVCPLTTRFRWALCPPASDWGACQDVGSTGQREGGGPCSSRPGLSHPPGLLCWKALPVPHPTKASLSSVSQPSTHRVVAVCPFILPPALNTWTGSEWSCAQGLAQAGPEE